MPANVLVSTTSPKSLNRSPANCQEEPVPLTGAGNPIATTRDTDSDPVREIYNSC